MYYKLEYDPADSAGTIERQNNQHHTFMRGALVDPAEVELPCAFTLTPEEEDGVQLLDYYRNPRLMSARLIETLRAAGVDNLQLFDAHVLNAETNEAVGDFSVVNIVGLVSCVKESASESTPVAGVKFFHKLRILPERVGGLKMFRLAESRMDIIVADEVAQALQEGAFEDRLDAVED